MRHDRPRSAGFSLVELMIALTIGALIATAGAGAFIASKKAFSLAAEKGRLQEKVRIANHFIASDLRGAGYFGCKGAKINVINTLNDSATPLYDYKGVRGNEATSATAWSPSLDSPVSGSSPLGGSDVIVIRGASAPVAYLETKPGNTSADLKVFPRTPQPLFDDDIVIITDCSAAAIFQITNYTPANGNVVHNTGGSTVPGNFTKDLEKEFQPGAEIIRLTSNSYFLKLNPENNPALYRLDNSGALVELVDHVEQLQITYGENTNNDANQTPDVYRDANGVESSGNWDNVTSLRICMLFRTASDNVARAAQTYTDCSGSSVTATDLRLRQAAWMTINLRNRTL